MCVCVCGVCVLAASSPKLGVVTLRQADAPLLQKATDTAQLSGSTETYLVFVPSPIFEFRRAVHDSPSVIYHPTVKLRIDPPARSRRQGILKKKTLFFLKNKIKSLHVMRAYSIGKLCIGREERKKKGGTTTSAARQPHTPHKLRTEIPSRESADCLTVIPTKKNEKRAVCRGSGDCVGT